MTISTEMLSGVGVLDEATCTLRCHAVLLLGPPGSGKGVQGDILNSIPGFYRFSSGEMFRHLDSTSKLGRRFLEYSTRGELVPDDLVIQLWLASVSAHAVLGEFKPAHDLLVLDGLPRTVVQARMLEPYLRVHKIIHLECRDIEVLVKRLHYRALNQTRSDDVDENVIRNRFVVYQKETEPVLAFYPAEKIASVDCLDTPVRVAARILTALAASYAV
jgi:adenylate kinase